MRSETAELYTSDKYQRTNDIESRLIHGLPIEKRNEFEVDQAIEALGDVKAGDRVLDLACGTGGHARVLRERLGVDIDARDISEPSIKEARRIEDEIKSTRADIRGHISFDEGSYGNVRESLPEDVQYKVVSILGGSFMYLKTAEEHQKAMQDFYDLLAPGGKIVIQFRDKEGRQRDQQKMGEWSEQLHVAYEDRRADGNVGKMVQAGTHIHVLKDTEVGDGFYYHGFKTLEPASDGTRRGGFRKVYFDESGNEEDMGDTTQISYVEKASFPKLQALMEKAGFKNVSIEGKPMSPDGAVMSYVVVGEKPDV